jgi:lysophospholipase L1-like esterase
MKKLLFLPLTIAFMTAAHAEPYRVVPIGDSITQGGIRHRAEYSYRYPLYYMLKDAGYDVDFIGSLQKGLHADATWPDKDGVPFDPDHEGRYGIQTAKALERLPAAMEQWSAAPDMALIHLGTNDLKLGNFEENTIAPMEEMIGLLREKNPKMIILIGHLHWKGGPAGDLRELVEDMAQRLSTEESPIVTVHHYEGLNTDPNAPEPDLFDGAHPNPSGQKKMAQKWFEAMKPFLPGE